MEPLPVRQWLFNLSRETQLFELEEQVNAPQPSDNVKWDHQFMLRPNSPGGPPFELLVEAKPRISPQVAVGLLPRMREDARAAVPALCCPVISARVAAMCREAGVSYFDADGNAFLRGPGLLVHISGRPRTPQEETEGAADPFAPKSSRIIRTLLSEPGRTWGVLELAKFADVSNGLASRIKDALMVEAYVKESKSGLQVRRPRELLEAWRTRYQPPGPVRSCYMMGTPQEAESQVTQRCEERGYRCALALFSGAARLAPMVRYNRATIYVDANGTSMTANVLLEQLNLKEVDTGANLGLVFVNDPSIFAGSRAVGAANVVSPLQLYLDLSKQAGRGVEAAEEVFERELRPLFDRTEER